MLSRTPWGSGRARPGQARPLTTLAVLQLLAWTAGTLAVRGLGWLLGYVIAGAGKLDREPLVADGPAQGPDGRLQALLCTLLQTVLLAGFWECEDRTRVPSHCFPLAFCLSSPPHPPVSVALSDSLSCSPFHPDSKGTPSRKMSWVAPLEKALYSGPPCPVCSNTPGAPPPPRGSLQSCWGVHLCFLVMMEVSGAQAKSFLGAQARSTQQRGVGSHVPRGACSWEGSPL